jgi:transcriptional regulator of aromatic amino acid metabolism
LDRSPSSGSAARPPFALDVDARIDELRWTGNFEKIENQMFNTSAIFETAKLIELYATFSEISILDPTERNRLLEKLAEIADRRFNGRVEKPIVTS